MLDDRKMRQWTSRSSLQQSREREKGKREKEKKEKLTDKRQKEWGWGNGMGWGDKMGVKKCKNDAIGRRERRKRELGLERNVAAVTSKSNEEASGVHCARGGSWDVVELAVASAQRHKEEEKAKQKG